MARVSSAQRRDDLVRAALRVIDRDGVHAATTRAIVAEEQVPLATFHYVFTSRDELIRELIAFVVEHERIAATEALAEATDIRELVRAGLRAYVDLLVADPGREQALFELFHYALRTEELHDLPAVQYENYRRAAHGLLEFGAAQAGVVWSIPTDELARLLVTISDGITLAWLADRDSDSVARTIDHAADLIAGFASPPPGTTDTEGAHA